MNALKCIHGIEVGNYCKDCGRSVSRVEPMEWAYEYVSLSTASHVSSSVPSIRHVATFKTSLS